MSRRKNAGDPGRGSDARLRATLRRFEGTRDAADAVAFATEFLRSHGSPPDGPGGLDLIRDEYMAHVRELAVRVVDRFDVEDGVVDHNDLVEGPEQAAQDDPWTRMDEGKLALQVLLVSPNAFYAANEGLLIVNVPANQMVNRWSETPGAFIGEAALVAPGGIIGVLAYYALVADLRDEVHRLMTERGISEA